MKLICYPTGSTPPRIRPAPSTRAWMDATNQSFAYRCLPLNIANAHGWEILSPCGFTAEWDGSDRMDSVKIIADAEATDPPVSHFGHGILTFHTHALFRTEPGYSLFVGGSTNVMKDGLQPLSGIIETEWAPYTFTMNWKFTRAHYPVRFEADEPFCMFYPVQLAAIDASEPEFRDLGSDPDLHAPYREWMESRETFLERLRNADPTATTAKWQKNYYRGLMPDGTSSAADHATKLQPRAFRDCRENGDGTEEAVDRTP